MNGANVSYLRRDATAKVLAEWAVRDLTIRSDNGAEGFSINLSTWAKPWYGYVVGGYSYEYPIRYYAVPTATVLENAINAALYDFVASIVPRYHDDYRLTPAQRRLRRLPLHDFVIGGWRESVDSPLIIEVSRIWKSLDHAYADGMERGQKAIYDVEHNHVITLPNRGD